MRGLDLNPPCVSPNLNAPTPTPTPPFPSPSSTCLTSQSFSYFCNWKAARSASANVPSRDPFAGLEHLCVMTCGGGIWVGCQRFWECGAQGLAISPALQDFQFSAITITKGWPRVETITDNLKAATSIQGRSGPHGERAFLTCAEQGRSNDENGYQLQYNYPR